MMSNILKDLQCVKDKLSITKKQNNIVKDYKQKGARTEMPYIVCYKRIIASLDVFLRAMLFF